MEKRQAFLQFPEINKTYSVGAMIRKSLCALVALLGIEKITAAEEGHGRSAGTCIFAIKETEEGPTCFKLPPGRQVIVSSGEDGSPRFSTAEGPVPAGAFSVYEPTPSQVSSSMASSQQAQTSSGASGANPPSQQSFGQSMVGSSEFNAQQPAGGAAYAPSQGQAPMAPAGFTAVTPSTGVIAASGAGPATSTAPGAGPAKAEGAKGGAAAGKKEGGEKTKKGGSDKKSTNKKDKKHKKNGVGAYAAGLATFLAAMLTLVM